MFFSHLFSHVPHKLHSKWTLVMLFVCILSCFVRTLFSLFLVCMDESNSFCYISEYFFLLYSFQYNLNAIHGIVGLHLGMLPFSVLYAIDLAFIPSYHFHALATSFFLFICFYGENKTQTPFYQANNRWFAQITFLACIVWLQNMPWYCLTFYYSFSFPASFLSVSFKYISHITNIIGSLTSATCECFLSNRITFWIGI